MIYFQDLKNSFLEIVAFFDTSPRLFLLLLIFLILIFFMGFLFAFLIVKTSVHSDRKKERKDAINRSRAVLSGQMLEQVAPFLPNFPCNPADVRFVGKPIDFVAFPGAVDNKPISEILFIEVKSGNSVLSEREKEIKNAVQKGKVRYVEYRVE
jgi:predicted Holliday junction resolvase-like endonuclease